MIKINLLIVALSFSVSLSAQSVISSAGYESGYSSWTIGEIMTEAITRSDAIIAQGFNQPFDISTTGVITILNNEVRVQAYPNPVIDRLQLFSNSNEQDSWTLYNLSGTMLSSGVLKEREGVVDFSDKLPGVYILHVQNKTNKHAILITKENHQ